MAVIALLLGILMPALGKARRTAKLAVCKSHLGQLGLGIVVYADQHQEYIPRGPACTGPFDFSCADIATNQLWIGAENEDHPNQPTGLGLLLKNFTPEARIYFCPADDTNNLEEELPRIGSERSAYGSYTYRQLDQLPPIGRWGVLSRLGSNLVGDVDVPVEALAFDTNCLGPGGPLRHTNHNAEKVNVLFRDRSVRTFSNKAGTFSILPEAFESPLGIFARLDQILINADYGYRHDPDIAPQLDDEP